MNKLNSNSSGGKLEREDSQARNCSRQTTGRRNNNSMLMIREITTDDSKNVCKLLYDHFRSLTIPAMIYWIVQHAHDLVAIVIINSMLLPIKNLFYFCMLFLIYLFVRARYEIEKHIKQCCPDLVDVYDTYRTTNGSNFWVAYFSQNNKSDSDSTIDTPIDSNRTDRTTIGDNNKMLLSYECKENEILGCIGITQYRNRSTIAQMVRLVVTNKCRNMRVGTSLLNHMESYALSLGYTEIRVFTNNLNTAYLHFLKQNGFEIIQIIRRGLMRGDLIIWTKILRPSPDGHTRSEDSSNNKVGDACFIPE